MTPAEVFATAAGLVEQYGVDAEVIATLRAAEDAAGGDLNGSDFWLAVAALVGPGGADAKPDG